jgi:DNA-binding NarL/FixJ family response regulator
MSDAVTCLIADDHPAVVRAVERFLERCGFDVVASVPDGASALEFIEEHEPRICIADVVMPRLDGIELASRVRDAGLQTRILIFSGIDDPTLGSRALAAGAYGVAAKSGPLVDLQRAIQVVDSGRFYLDPQLVDRHTGAPLGESPNPLSNRESTILHLLSDGQTYVDISSELAISVETVRTHVKHAKSKLGAHTRTQAVAVALRDSLIS